MTGMRMDRAGVLSLDGNDRVFLQYAPRVVAFDGLGSLGQSSTTMARIDRVQKDLAVRNAEVNATDSRVWDTIWGKLSGISVPGTSVPFTGWSWTRDRLIGFVSKVGVTASYTPPESLLAAAETFVRDVGVMLDYYKRVAPEVAAVVNAAAADMRARMAKITPLSSPEEVGWATFQREIEKRTQAFSSGIGFGAGLGTVLLAALAAFLLSR